MNRTNKNKEKEYLSTRKAAEILGVAVSTIQLWTDNGILQGWTTVGGHRRISRASIDQVINQRDSSRQIRQEKKNTHEPLKLVLVEDDPAQRSLYRKQFQARGLDIELIEASNGYEGLIQIGKYQPKIIITDLLMPNMDGFVMLKALQNSPELEDCLIIVSSALAEDEIKRRGMLTEDVLFFRKPVSFDELEITILKQIIKMK